MPQAFASLGAPRYVHGLMGTPQGVRVPGYVINNAKNNNSIVQYIESANF